jgi:hypothetical protein
MNPLGGRYPSLVVWNFNGSNDAGNQPGLDDEEIFAGVFFKIGGEADFFQDGGRGAVAFFLGDFETGIEEERAVIGEAQAGLRYEGAVEPAPGGRGILEEIEGRDGAVEAAELVFQIDILDEDGMRRGEAAKFRVEIFLDAGGDVFQHGVGKKKINGFWFEAGVLRVANEGVEVDFFKR